jgi:hypothetical protein
MSTDTTFEQAVANVPTDCRCVQIGEGRIVDASRHGDLFFGVSPGVKAQPSNARTVELDSIPSFSYGVHFFSGPHNEDLVRAFAGSDFARRVNRLSFGTCTYSKGEVPDGSYMRIVETLAGGEYPMLDTLSIGEFPHMYAFRAAWVHRVGALDDLLAKTPNLTVLDIVARATLHRPVDLPHLQSLTISTGADLDGFQPVPGPETPGTIANLFASNLPNLRNVNLEIQIGPRPVFHW